VWGKVPATPYTEQAVVDIKVALQSALVALK